MANIQKYTVASGRRYRLYWRDPSGRQHGKVYKRWDQAVAAKRKIEGDLQSGGYTDPARGRILLRELWSDFIEAPPRPLAESTKVLYEQQWRLHIEPWLGNRPLNSLEQTDVRRFVADLKKAGVGPAMTDSTFRLLRALLGYAVQDRRLAYNPASGVAPSPVGRKEVRIVTPDEVERIADEVPVRYHALVLTLAWTGIRIGEAAALRIRNLNILNRQLHVVEAVSEIGGRRVEHPPKTRQLRAIKLPQFLAKELDRHLKTYTSGAPDDLVFLNENGGPVGQHAFRRTFQRACKRAGIVPVPRVHDLRHTAASLAIRVGSPAILVQDLLGHSQIGTTMGTYGHLYEPAHAEVAEKLDALREAVRRGNDDSSGTVVELPAAENRSDEA